MNQMSKQKTFKTITFSIKDCVNFVDVEEIKALNLKEATKLVSDIQVAEYKQANKNYTKDLEYYSVLFEQKVGFVQGEEDFVTLVVGLDNEWYQYLNTDAKWNSIIELEWEDYVNEIVNEIN